MNQLSFWLGFFAGSFSLTIILLIWLRRMKSGAVSSDEIRAYNEETIRLMAERNATDRLIAEALRHIADRPA